MTSKQCIHGHEGCNPTQKDTHVLCLAQYRASVQTDDTCGDFEPRFTIGTRVRKVKGYAFPGTVVSVFRTQKNLERYVVECDVPEVNGILHIYGPNDLELVD